MHALFDINARLKSKQTDAKFEAYDHEITLTGIAIDFFLSLKKTEKIYILSKENIGTKSLQQQRG